MPTSKELIREFLAQRRLAVAGVSRDPQNAANLIFRKLRDTGHEVVPINPRASEVEGAVCYPNLQAAPAPLDGVVVVTRPEDSLAVVQQCAAAGIARVWMHRSFGPGSVSDAAISLCRDRGIHAIAGGCPMMFCEPVDVGHRCIRWVVGMMGRMPK